MNPQPPRKRIRLAAVTERTFYAALLDIIRELGGSGVQEVQYNSAPDIEFEYLERRWLLSVKIGENPKIIKDSFLQYLRHKEESGLTDGLLLLLPESIRRTPANADAVRAALLTARSTMLVDSALVKDELREVAFPDALRLLRLQYGAAERKHYPLSLVINLLRAQVVDMMERLSLDEDALLRIVTSKDLLSSLGRLKGEEADNVGTFLQIRTASRSFLNRRSARATSWPASVLTTLSTPKHCASSIIQLSSSRSFLFQRKKVQGDSWIFAQRILPIFTSSPRPPKSDVWCRSTTTFVESSSHPSANS